jgi:tetratricopeptide (TPR) repeat protein
MNKELLEEQLSRSLSYLEQDQKNINLILSISAHYRDLGDFSKAEEYLEKASALSGQVYWNQKGLIDLADNRIESALDSFRLAYEKEESPEHRYNLAYCLHLHQQFEEALDILKPGGFYEAELLKAKLLHHLGRLVEATFILETLHKLDRSKDEPLGLLALIYFDNNQPDLALFYAKKALALNNKNYDARLVKALLNINESSIEEIQFLVNIQPKNCRTWFALGVINMQKMQFSQALEAFLKAIDLWPEFYDSWISAAWCYLFQNNVDKAEEAYENAIHISEELGEAWAGKSLVLALNSQIEEAKIFLQKAKEKEPNCLLVQISEVILLNALDPKLASEQLQKKLPKTSMTIQEILTQALNQIGLESTTIH